MSSHFNEADQVPGTCRKAEVPGTWFLTHHRNPPRQRLAPRLQLAYVNARTDGIAASILPVPYHGLFSGRFGTVRQGYDLPAQEIEDFQHHIRWSGYRVSDESTRIEGIGEIGVQYRPIGNDRNRPIFSHIADHPAQGVDRGQNGFHDLHFIRNRQCGEFIRCHMMMGRWRDTCRDVDCWIALLKKRIIIACGIRFQIGNEWIGSQFCIIFRHFSCQFNEGLKSRVAPK